MKPDRFFSNGERLRSLPFKKWEDPEPLSHYSFHLLPQARPYEKLINLLGRGGDRLLWRCWAGINPAATLRAEVACCGGVGKAHGA